MISNLKIMHVRSVRTAQAIHYAMVGSIAFCRAFSTHFIIRIHVIHFTHINIVI